MLSSPLPLGTHSHVEGSYNHLIDQGQTSSGTLCDVELKDSCLDNDKDPKLVHVKVDLNAQRIVHSTSAHNEREHLYEQKHSRNHTKSWIQSNLDTDVRQMLVGNLSMKLWMAEIHVGGVPSECYICCQDRYSLRKSFCVCTQLSDYDFASINIYLHLSCNSGPLGYLVYSAIIIINLHYFQ